MRRVVIDSCSVDPLADIPGAYEAVRQAIDSGELEILYTHVTIDEAAATPDLEKRRLKLNDLTTLGRPVTTGAFIIGRSRLEQARLTDEPGAATVEALGSNRLGKHGEDALIAITAQVEGCALLTEEKRRLRRRAAAHGIEVLNCEELFNEIGFQGR
jgi:hypothetical protein